MRGVFLLLSTILVTLPACGDDDRPGSDGGGGSDVTSSDPRCAALCAIDTSGLDQCTTASATQCVALCEARIDGAANLCAECLLEDARFTADPGIVLTNCGSSASCPTEECELRGCMYCNDDATAREACEEMVGMEISCDPEFAPVADCASLCS